MNDFDKFFGAAYDLVDVIKSDGKNFVATAYDKHAKRLCVIKERDARLTDVYKILRELDNPHVPKIYRMFERDGKLIVIEEHIDGQTLDEILTYSPEILSEKLVEKIFMEICDALVELHNAKIIHRDLTPSNIMLSKDNSVKLVDFGIARIFKPESSADTEFLGTRGYAAPEQFGVFDLGQTDARTDIFVLGTTVKILFGKNYNGRLAKVLKRCTDLNPASRYQSVPELIQAVKRARKLYVLKKFTLTAAIFGVIFFAVQTINFPDKQTELPPVVDEEIPPPETVAETSIEEPQKISDEKIPSTSNTNTADDQLISFVNKPQSAQIFELPDVQTSSLPNRPAQNFGNLPDVQISPSPTPPVPKVESQPEASPVEENKSARKSRLADRVKLYLYLNGKLTENNGEHTTMGTVNFPDDKIFLRNDNGDLLFPDNFSARLVIENFTAKDLINPQISVTFGKEKIFLERPTVKSGQTIEVEIPLGNRIIFRNGSKSVRLTVTVMEPGADRGSVLVRDLKINS